MPAVDNASEPRLDTWTIGAIAIIAWAIADLLHEGGGHGGTALLVGARPEALSSAYFSYDETTVSHAAARLISAGGSVLNVIIGLPLVLLSRHLRAPSWRFFVWLLAALNLLTAFGYLCFSSVSGIGDWAVVIDGLPHQIAWRFAEAVAGTVLYFFVTPWLLWPGLRPFVGGLDDREARARKLTLLPYLVGGCTSVASGVLNPLGMKIVLISSVAAAFGGASLLAWFFPPMAKKHKSGIAASLGIARGNLWIAFAVFALVIFIGVFGRGLTFPPH